MKFEDSEVKDPCEHCNDGDGECIYPSYGVAPHIHDLSKTESLIGSTVILPKEEWPEEFKEDPECPGLGTYRYCPVCGARSF